MASRSYNLSLTSTHVTLSDSLTPHVCLTILISACDNANSFSLCSQAKFHCREAYSFLHMFYTPPALNLYDHIKTAEQRTIIQKYGDWYNRS